jgi:LmbE family N-acetylglucosaminyl deacetylase
MKVMVFSAHPDDETLGAGGTIAKHVKNGDEVKLCIATSAFEPKWSRVAVKRAREEALNVKKILGIQHIEFLELPATKLDTIPKTEIIDKYKKIIYDFLPKIIYTPHICDLHNDHKVVFECVLVASRPVKECPIKKVLAFEVLSSTEWGALSNNNLFNPNKIKALKAYKQELKTWPHPRSIKAVESLARYRGASVGMEAAEAFMLIRENIEL